MRKRLAMAFVLAIVAGLGAHAVSVKAFPPGPPCFDDPNVQCTNLYDPVVCQKPGEGWRIYSNPCRAMKDCAKACRPLEE